MKKGSFFITLTKRLPSTDFTVIESDMHKMSWGEATIFVLQKITEPYTDNRGDSDDEQTFHSIFQFETYDVFSVQWCLSRRFILICVCIGK